MAKKKYIEESERKLIESVNNARIPTDWDEFERQYHEMERYGKGEPRKVDKEKMEYIEDGLVSRGIEGNQLSSLLSTIVEESGGNPFSVDDSGKFRGLIQFSKERYPEKDFNRDKKAGWKKAVDNQLDAIVDHLNEYGGDYGFLDGGDGSGYMTGKEAKDAFWGRDSDIENVTRALTYGFVRPGDRSGTTENRTRVARLINEIIQPPVETPDILEFDYDGKHYKATKPEEVTPEMRRALMLSKLVGEKNSVELQDSLYTTFNEAYGRAKNKGASVFMWNGKKYSTKEEGGEVKDMEKFGKVLESLYNEDVERVRNGEKAQYFGALNDKPLENVYPEFDLISKPAQAAYKGADMIANSTSKIIPGRSSGFLEKGLEDATYWTGKVGDFMRALYLGATRPIFNALPESVKPLARQVFKGLYNWRHFTLPETVQLSRELFGGEDEPESFDAAFKAAREQGLDTFEWNGNEYSTEIKEEGGEINAAECSLPGVNPKRPDGGSSKRIPEDDILALVLSSNANFVNRLKQEGRRTIPDWKVEGNIATHKLSAEIGEDGRVYVYPNVQEIDGKLKDFTDPKYGYPDEGRWDAMDSAIEHNDYVVFPDIESAVWFTENYKNKGWFPEFLDGGLSRLAPRDNTSVGHPGKSEDINRNLGVHKDPIDFTELAASFVPVVGDVMDVQDFIRAREEGDNIGMLLASLGFLPIVGGIASAANKARRVARLTSHLQGEDAVKMFKEYGRTDIPENSELAKQLKLYLPDIRNRYGLVGNDAISDDDIIGSIYKHVVELSGDSKNLNDMGEPQILFRGDTKRYDELMDRITPEDLVEGTGTMDNSLGNLFLDRIPEEGSREGIDRYLNTVNADKWGSIELSPSATGSGIVSNKGNVYKDSQRVKKLPSDVVFLYKRGDGTDIYRMPVKFSNDGANDINGFIVRTGNVRDATREIAIDDNYALTSGAFNLHAKRPTTDEEGFIVDESTMRAFDNIEDEKAYVRRRMAEHYSNLLKDAEANNQGLLRSGYFVDERGRRFNPFRGEHTDYNYYALPNFNKQNAKHVLPYDLRVPTDWSDANIYRKEGGPSDLAPRDNTSVGRPGSAKVPPVIPSDAARNNPVVSTIASFTPIIGEMLDIRDLYTSLKNNDKTGVLLALTGLIPVIGGVAGNVIKKNNPFWRKKTFSPEELAKDEELISKFPDYAHPNSPMGASVLNHKERLANGAFRKFRNIPAARVGVDSETGNIIYDFNGLDFNFIDVSNSDELKKVAEFYGTTPEEFISGLDKAPFFNYLDHVFIDRKLLEDMADTEELQFRFRDGVPSGSPQEEVLRSHEINHLVNRESKRESAEENGFSFDWLENNEEIGPGYDEYFRVNDNTEIAARGSQIKDYFGLTSPEQKITPEMLEYAARHYIFDYGVNNDMDLFFRSIKDYDKAAKWINKYATAGLGAYWLFDRASLNDDNFLNGGPIKFARRLNGDSIFERNMISPWKTLIDKPEKKFPKRNIKMPNGGSYNLAPRDNTSVGRPGPADVQPVKPSAAARENPVVPFVASLLPGIGDVIDAHDFIQAAKDKNMVGMALAAAGFIPLIGDAFQEAARFARGRRNSYIRYDAPPRRNDIKESDEELLRKMPDYARPGYPAMEALNVHRRRLSDGAYEQRTGQSGSEAKRELEGFAETFPGIYDRIFDLDYINEDDMEAARRVIEIIDKQPKGSAGTMSDEGVVKRLDDIKQRLVRSSPAFAEGIKGNSGIISLDNWSDFFMDEAYRSGISHELDHAVYLNTPEETIKELSGKVDGWFDPSKIENENIRNYVSKPMELLARGTQIKDFYGLTDNAEKVTPEMLKFAARHYADNVMDNQMTEFFNGIKDWDKAAEWISKYSTATLPAIAVSKLLQDGKEKDEYPVNKRHGGPISEDGSVGGDYILDDGGRSLYRRSEYIKNRLLSKYNLLPEESDNIISDLIRKSSLDEKFYDPRHKSYGIGQWSGKDLKEFILTYKDGGLVDQIDFLAKKYWDDFGKDGKGDIESGVFDEHRWVVKRIGDEEFYTNSPLLKTLPSMSREDVALSLLPPELWPGILKRKEDVTGRSARRHFIRGGEVSELQDYIYDRLTKEHGIAPIQAIGIVANLTQESALDYEALGDNGRSYGIQQWQGDRRKNLFEFAKKRGRDEPALDDQVDFLVEEYKDNGFLFPTRGENMYKTGKTDKDMFDYFQYSKLDFDNATNIYDSTRAWAQGFGRGNKNFLNMDRRFHIAKTLSSRYNVDAGGQGLYTDMGYKDEWGSPIPEVAVSAEKKVAQDDWMEKYGNKMLASILAGDGEGGDTHVTNNYYVNEEGLSEDEKRNAAEVRELQQKQQAQELLASIIDGIKLDIKGVTEVGKR